MAATKDNYQIVGHDLPSVLTDLNFKLQRLAERIDQIEGIRGTATMSSNLNLSGNSLVSVGNFDQDLGTGDTPSFGGLTIDGDVSVTGDLTVDTDFTASGDATLSGDTTIADAKNVILNTTTGTKIGTASTQKVAFLGATPAAQRAKINDPSGGVTVDSQARTAINSIIDSLEAFGFNSTT